MTRRRRLALQQGSNLECPLQPLQLQVHLKQHLLKGFLGRGAVELQRFRTGRVPCVRMLGCTHDTNLRVDYKKID